MAASIFRLTCQQGLSFSLDLALDTETGLDVDLGDFEVSMEIKMTRSSTSKLVIELNEANTRVVVDRVLRTINFNLAGVDTAAIAVGTYYYEILLASPYVISGSEKRSRFRLIEGRFEITV